MCRLDKNNYTEKDLEALRNKKYNRTAFKLSSKYKLTKNDINQDLLLEYVVESYSVEPIQDNEKEKNVKFKFSLKYTVLGKEELIRSKEIEFKIDASHENDTNYNIKIIVEKQVDDLVSSILENNFPES